jgi:hypothetical protein
MKIEMHFICQFYISCVLLACYDFPNFVDNLGYKIYFSPTMIFFLMETALMISNRRFKDFN